MNATPGFLDRLLIDVSPQLILFLGQALIVILAVVGIIAAIAMVLASLGMRPKSGARLEAKSLNDEWAERKRSLESFFLSKKEWKAKMKEDRDSEKSRIESGTTKPRLWVLDFKGDIEASRTESLRNEITAILDLVAGQKSKSNDEVLLRLESPGGTVTGYGLAAAQLSRLRVAGVKLTVAIDEIAASGGYMMAVVADRIVASPFAVIGSIGVIGGLPNVHRLLKRFDVDYLEITAGQHKRPVSVLGPLTEEGIEKFRTQLRDTHTLFRDHVKHYRPQLDLEKVATGDVWHGTDSLKVGLVDVLATSDELIDRARHQGGKDVIHLSWMPARSWKDRFEDSVSVIFTKSLSKALNRVLFRADQPTAADRLV